ncbi:MAG: DUF86 domain-containing protein [Anaerolineae bacterium]|nr:DUF86 domain-containing protein [Anaerolineae bacterium]
MTDSRKTALLLMPSAKAKPPTASAKVSSMSKRSGRESLADMQEAIQRIGAYTAGMDYDSFCRDTKTQDAVIRNLEIIGEAVRNLLLTCGQKSRKCHGKTLPASAIG